MSGMSSILKRFLKTSQMKMKNEEEENQLLVHNYHFQRGDPLILEHH